MFQLFTLYERKANNKYSESRDSDVTWITMSVSGITLDYSSLNTYIDSTHDKYCDYKTALFKENYLNLTFLIFYIIFYMFIFLELSDKIVLENYN